MSQDASIPPPDATKVSAAGGMPGDLPDRSEIAAAAVPHANCESFIQSAWARHLRGGAAAQCLILLLDEASVAGFCARVADFMAAPIYPWDAVLCSSESVRKRVLWTLRSYVSHMRSRLGVEHIRLPRIQCLRPCLWLPDVAGKSISGAVCLDGRSSAVSDLALEQSRLEGLRNDARNRLGVGVEAVLIAVRERSDLHAMRAALWRLQFAGADLSGVMLILPIGLGGLTDERQSVSVGYGDAEMLRQAAQPDLLSNVSGTVAQWEERCVMTQGLSDLVDLMSGCDLAVQTGFLLDQVGSAGRDDRSRLEHDALMRLQWVSAALSCAVALLMSENCVAAPFLASPQDLASALSGSGLPGSTVDGAGNSAVVRALDNAAGVRVPLHCLPGGLVGDRGLADLRAGFESQNGIGESLSASRFGKSPAVQAAKNSPAADVSGASAIDISRLALVVGALIAEPHVLIQMGRKARQIALEHRVGDQLSSVQAVAQELAALIDSRLVVDDPSMPCPLFPETLFRLEAAGAHVLRPDTMVALSPAFALVEDRSGAGQRLAELVARHARERMTGALATSALDRYELSDEEMGDLLRRLMGSATGPQTAHSPKSVASLLSGIASERQMAVFVNLPVLIKLGVVEVCDGGKPIEREIQDVCANLTGVRWQNNLERRASRQSGSRSVA